MSALSDAILALNPNGYWRLNEATGGPIDSDGTHAEGTYHNSPTRQVSGRTGDGDTAISLNGTNQYASIAGVTAVIDPAFSILLFPLQAAAPAAKRVLWAYVVDGSNYITLYQSADGTVGVDRAAGFGSTSDTTDAAVDLSAARTLAVVASDALSATILVDGVAVASTQSGFGGGTISGTGTHYIGADAAGADPWDGTIDDVAFWINTTISAANVLSITTLAEADPGPQNSAIPMRLQGYLSTAASSLPMRLLGMSQTPASSLPMRLEAPDPAHFTAAAARFGALILLGGTDITDRLTGPIRIMHEETASALCSLEITPETGTLDPADYERKRIEVSFVGMSSTTPGLVLYTRRRFTGVTSTATHDPDAGTLTIEATTDLQGLFENLPRAATDSLLPGSRWSEYVFDASADGWQYALDRLSTIPSEMHIDEYGHFVVSPFARKAMADVTFTDSARFDNTLRLERVNRRDLLTRIRVNMDFRFVRLRHRELGVHLIDTFGFCDYLDRGWELPSKAMIQSAADSGEWTRIGDISYTDLPGPGSYCSPLRGWTGNAGAFCLGAFWRASRRWAQTVTEEYALDVVCSDLEEAVGRIGIEEDYGLEAIYDATDFERVQTYSAPPTGAVLSGSTDDWMLDATAVEAGGRTELEDAQECAIAKAQAEILARARGNRVSLSPVYRPDLSLHMTVAVDTPYLECTGKLARIEETIDPARGVLEQSIEIALSRHGGSGLAVTDTPAPATEPDPPAETPTPRHYYMGYRIGGTENAPADDPDWDGYISNVAPVLRFSGAPVYQTRFVVRMPEIEASARDAIEVQAAETYGVAVPQDPLIMGV